MSTNDLIAAAKTANLSTCIIHGELHIIGRGPALISFRYNAIESGCRYLGGFNVNAHYVESTGCGVNGLDNVARFAF